MISKAAVALTVFIQIMGADFSAAQSPNVIGIWTVAIAFENGENRSLRFEARESGKGSFLLLDPKLKVWGPATPSEAKWTHGDDGSVTLSGAVEFPLGNVGRDAGTLVLKGQLKGDSISGEATFFRPGQDSADSRPSKSGSFKATRASG